MRQFGTAFLATAAGTDSTPPVVTLPTDNEVEVGEVFDPLAGVSAVDNTDGDVMDLIEVVGSVDTLTPGSYALTYVATDTNGNQVLVPRAVRVVEPVGSSWPRPRSRSATSRSSSARSSSSPPR